MPFFFLDDCPRFGKFIATRKAAPGEDAVDELILNEVSHFVASNLTASLLSLSFF